MFRLQLACNVLQANNISFHFSQYNKMVVNDILVIGQDCIVWCKMLPSD